MPDVETPAAPSAEAPAAQPAPSSLAPPSVSGDPSIESRRQAAFAAVQAEAAAGGPEAASGGGEQPAVAEQAVATGSDEPATPGDSSAAPVAASEAPAEAGAQSTGSEGQPTESGQPRVKFSDLSRTDKAQLLTELRPMMAELQQENDRLRAEQQQTVAQRQAAARGRAAFYGMDEQGTDAPYLEVVQKAEAGDWDAIQERKRLEQNRQFGFDAIQQAQQQAHASVQAEIASAQQVARELGGPGIEHAMASNDLGQVFRAIDATATARTEQKWQAEKAELVKAHKAEIAALEQSHKTKLARALGEMPSPESAGTPGPAPGLIASALRGSREDREALRERIRTGEMRNVALN